MRNLGRIGFFLVAAALAPLSVHAGSSRMQNLSIEDGLSLNFVTCIRADRRGFIWFGTPSGLNRYDGYNFKIFTHRRGDVNSLSHDHVNTMAAGPDGSFWIGTIGGGLSHFDPLRERFTNYCSRANDPNSLSNDSLRAILPDGNDRIWIGTDNGLTRFDVGSGRFTRYLCAQEFSGASARNAIYSLHKDAAGILWAGSADGLYRLDVERQAIGRFVGDRSDPYAREHGQINAIFEDGRGVLWLGTERGLVRFDKESRRFHYKGETVGILPHLYRSPIFDFFRDRQGRVWVATESGMYLFPGQDLLAIYFQAGAIPLRLLMNRFVISVYQDREDIIWAGTRSGIYKYDPRTQQFAMYGSEIADVNRASEVFPVTAVCRDSGGDLWIGTYKHGLFRVRRELDETITLIPLPCSPAQMKNTVIQALLAGRDRMLWVGTNRGLYAYDLGRGVFRGHYTSDPGSGGLSHDRVTSLCEDRSGRLWVGTENGMDLFDRRRGTFATFRDDESPSGSSTGNFVIAICQDRLGFLWVGTNGSGLRHFDPERRIFIGRYRQEQGDPASLRSDKISCLLEDRRGHLWIGTNGGGLNRLEKGNESFAAFASESGLANNDIQGLLEDAQGRLWLSTNRGLYQFDPQRRSMRSFTTRDGLQGDEFNARACYKSENGDMYFGGINGLTWFSPAGIKDNPYVPPVIITEMEVFNRGQKFSGDFSRLRELKLGPNDRVVSFTFTALSLSDPGRNQYMYMIEGLDPKWIHIGTRHEVTISNLKPGRFVFRVKGSNNHGLWNERGTFLAIFMRPFWWQTWWFRLLLFMLLLSLFGFLRSTRTRRMARRIRNEAAMEKFFAAHQMSPREREIVLLLLKGKSNREIESTLFIAIGTVKNHVCHIYQKIGVKNRAQLITLFKNLQMK
jgi:ligand-binding sensor domain-containing protein/DNA-binding CsgD family transcriptional regulator